MTEIIRIDDRTYRFEDGGVRFFLLLGSRKGLLVDTGMNCENARELAQSLTDLPIELINTHGDPDHIAGNKAFDQLYMNINEEGNYRQFGGTGKILSVKEGDHIDLGDRDVMVIDLPGHTPGSIALLDVEGRILIGGDSVQSGNIFMFGKQRNLEDYVQSMKHLLGYMDEFDAVYPSHGEFPVGKDIVPKLIEGAQKILDGEAESTEVEMRGDKIRLYRFDYAGFLCER